MEKNYNHLATEDQHYYEWEKSGKMISDVSSNKEPFTIVLPPPNITGQLHLGHAAMLAIEDIMIRFQKMSGREVCWIPGTDHAAIATENVVIKYLGLKSREELSREEFLAECRKFASEKHDRIVHQIKKMGAWLDWSREAYTFDKERTTAVNTIFEQLYNDGLIVRGHRLINWSIGAQSVLADDEVEWGETTEPFYYIKCGEFIIGTVRPETKCANSPLIVNPDATYLRIKYTAKSREISENFILVKNCWENETERKKVLNLLDEDGTWEVLESFQGTEVVGREFEDETYAGKRKFVVIADEVVDPNKGSGAMTISCNHSADDYDLGKRLKLDEYFFDKIDFSGKMKAVAGPAKGLSIQEARKFAGKLMEEQGLLTGIDKNYSHRVPLCYRSNCVVEPMVSPQWFISVEKEFTDKFTGQKTTLKKQMQEAVRKKHVKIIPARFEKIYFQWIDNLRDWCISRQIWWGHQIPVFYCQDCQAENVFSADKLANKEQLFCSKCQSKNIKQDEDTLDTWFSSALWPFSTLGWPDQNSRDLAKFYPNNVMETGHDILFFWVARMIMFGKYITGEYPFKTVYLHGLVCDEKGQKMSKSKGNGIDPLELIEEVGADAVRLSLVIGTTPGNSIPIGKNKIKGYRNFVNKLWNAGRFVQMQLDQKNQTEKELSLADKWILDRFSQISREINEHLNKYAISLAGDKIYHFIWDEFCDWYLEAHKVAPNPVFLSKIFLDILKLAHPLVPFVTEELWKNLTKNDNTLLIENDYPKPEFVDQKSREIFAQIQIAITEIRKIRAENKINPKDRLAINDISPLDPESKKLISQLAKVEFKQVDKKSSTKFFAENWELALEIPVDEQAVANEIKNLENQIENLNQRLLNKKYVQNAPKELVSETRENLAQAKEKLAKLKK